MGAGGRGAAGGGLVVGVKLGREGVEGTMSWVGRGGLGVGVEC